MRNPTLYSNPGFASLYHRGVERSVLEIVFSLIIAALIAAITFVPIAAAGSKWFFM